uniref:Uncharacterized protein n=1 Tax=Oryza glumipatula TaxID=40148 RepID=A0A0E0AHW0_9ORYZ
MAFMSAPHSLRFRFCVLPMARSLVDVAVSSVTYAADSVSQALERCGTSSPIAYLPPLSLHRKQQTWFRELEHVGVIADTKSLQLLYNMDTSQSPVDFPCSMKKVMLASTFQQ